MFEPIFVLQDPATGMYWDGEIPGRFSSEWRTRTFRSEQTALDHYDLFIEYTAARVTNTSPQTLTLIQLQPVHLEVDQQNYGPEARPMPFIMAAYANSFRRNSKLQKGKQVLAMMLEQNVRLEALVRTKYGEAKIEEKCAPTVIYKMSSGWGNWFGVSSLQDLIVLRSVLEQGQITNIIDLLPILELAKTRNGAIWQPNEPIKSQPASPPRTVPNRQYTP